MLLAFSTATDALRLTPKMEHLSLGDEDLLHIEWVPEDEAEDEDEMLDLSNPNRPEFNWTPARGTSCATLRTWANNYARRQRNPKKTATVHAHAAKMEKKMKAMLKKHKC